MSHVREDERGLTSKILSILHTSKPAQGGNVGVSPLFELKPCLLATMPLALDNDLTGLTAEGQLLIDHSAESMTFLTCHPREIVKFHSVVIKTTMML